MKREWRDALNLRRTIARRLLLTRLGLISERILASFWGVFTLLVGALAFALFDLAPLLPGWVHGLLLLVAGGALVDLIRRGLRSFHWPTSLESRHRLEDNAAVGHRPLTAWQDTLGQTDTPAQGVLWRAHRNRMRRLISQLTVPLPRPVVAARDTLTLRAVALMALAVAVIGAWGDITPRLVRAVTPALATDQGPIQTRVWITPPEYTRKPPILLEAPASAEAKRDGPIVVPDGSTVLAVVTGSPRRTQLMVDQTAIPLEPMDDYSYRYEGPLPAGRILEVRQLGRMLGRWPIEPVTDTPPTIAFDNEPAETGRGRLRIAFTASDDYGVTSARVELTRPEDDRIQAQNWATSQPLSLPPLSNEAIEGASFHDFAAHPWAGHDVTLQLSATDAAEQVSTSEPIRFRLPERTFSHPVAALVISLRKTLIDDLSTARTVAGALDRLLERPEDYGGNVVVHLALSTSRARLVYGDAQTELDAILDLMWQAAVRMEDGALAVAEQALEEAERALTEAVERGAPAAEINRLINRLQQALADYMRAMAEQMPQSTMPMAMDTSAMEMLRPEDIAQMMQQLGQLSELGAQDAAREMLANLQNMLNMLRNAAQASGEHPEVEAAREMLGELQDIAERESEMLNESFDKSRDQAMQRGRREPGERQGEQLGDAADKQDQLRRQLGDLMGRMAEMTGDVPDGLSGAEQSMRDATEALESGSWRAASDAQAEALSQLQQGMESAAQQMMQALAQQGIAGMIPMPGGPGQPFGPNGPQLGPDSGEDVELPTAPDVRGLSQRSRAILEEIRRRAADRTRTLEERQYLERLLRRF